MLFFKRLKFTSAIKLHIKQFVEFESVSTSFINRLILEKFNNGNTVEETFLYLLCQIHKIHAYERDLVLEFAKLDEDPDIIKIYSWCLANMKTINLQVIEKWTALGKLGDLGHYILNKIDNDDYQRTVQEYGI